jgi:predicted transcriptional regulator
MREKENKKKEHEQGLTSVDSSKETSSPVYSENKELGDIITGAEKELAERFSKGTKDKYGRFILAALSSIPWVGVLSAIGNIKAENDQDGINFFLRLWLQEHKEKIKELQITISDILGRLDTFGDEVRARIESPEYLALVRRTFRSWDQADTLEKRLMFKRLLMNAGAITLCPDDQVRLFISWIERYHESHFAVIKEVYQRGPISKGKIWDNIHSENRPSDNSSEAGLFGYLMRELNLGGIIHLDRETNASGQAYRSKRSSGQQSSKSDTLESPFEDSKQWTLSSLGREFVRYVMEDVDPQLNEG